MVRFTRELYEERSLAPPVMLDQTRRNSEKHRTKLSHFFHLFPSFFFSPRLVQVLREGMGQAAGVGAAEVLETVITNALVLDYTGIYKADLGMKGGLISSIGKAGNPDVMDVSLSTQCENNRCVHTDESSALDKPSHDSRDFALLFAPLFS